MPNDDATLIETARRRNQVIQLREAGATWQAIANALRTEYGEDRLPNGWDERYAYKDFKRALRQLNNDTQESLQTVRQMELRRLNRMMRGVWENAINGDKGAIDRVLKIMERRANLLGVDAPDRVNMTMDVDWEKLTDEELREIRDGKSVEAVLRERQNDDEA